MIKSVEEQVRSKVICMCDMKPYEIGRTLHGGELVMRTASELNPEIMSLSEPRPDGCWTGPSIPNTKVKLLRVGCKIILEVT